jgi:hypothetical protein
MLILAMKLALAIPARRISAAGHIHLLMPLGIIPIQLVRTGILRVTHPFLWRRACMLLLRASFQIEASCETFIPMNDRN